jgi:hypothetical protein
MFYHSCQGLAFPLAHHHDTAALAVLVFAPTPIDPRGAMIFRPDMAAKPAAVELNNPAQSCRGGMRNQGAS